MRAMKLLCLWAIGSMPFLTMNLIAVESSGSKAAFDYWVEPMKQVHARFTGAKGTFAEFGDSISVTMAFWSPLAGEPKNMNMGVARDHALVKGYIKPECWSKWKGPGFGNEGSMTIQWALDNVDGWLKKLNPEVTVIMFGSNDVGQLSTSDYERQTREVIQRCLKNGTVVLLTTAPPRNGHVEKSTQFAQIIRQIAQEEKVPLIDFFGEILKRRPADWDGSLPKFKSIPGNEYEVPTLIARDGVHPSNTEQYANDFSNEGLRNNGYTLRNYLTLIVYAEVIEKVLRPGK